VPPPPAAERTKLQDNAEERKAAREEKHRVEAAARAEERKAAREARAAARAKEAAEAKAKAQAAEEKPAEGAPAEGEQEVRAGAGGGARVAPLLSPGPARSWQQRAALHLCGGGPTCAPLPLDAQETAEERGRRIAAQWTNDPAAAGAPVRRRAAGLGRGLGSGSRQQQQRRGGEAFPAAALPC
jgi:hypothetical protein